MKPRHVHRVVRDLDLDELLDTLHPDLIGPQSPNDLHHGVGQAVRHALRVNATGSGWLRVSVASEFNPTGLRDTHGHRMGLLTSYVPGQWDRHEDPVLVTEQEHPDLFRQRPEPAWGVRPPFPAGEPIRAPHLAHLLAHPQRWPGYDPSQVRARLPRAISEMTRELRPWDVGGYYYLDPANRARSGWCWVAPLWLGRSDAAIPAVLRPGAHGLDLITVLPRHDAFWNVACTGRQPPAWLHDRDVSPATAA